MALLFISSVVPDKPEFHNAAFTRSGNNVLYGIADALWQKGYRDLISYRPTPSFPRGKIWFRSEDVVFESGMKVLLLPIFNIKIAKNIFEGLYTFLYVLRWSQKHKGEDNKVLVYNIYDPPVSFLYKACRLTHTKLYVILYDLGVPPKRLGLSKATMLAYKISERSAKKYIPKLDGRIVINESIIRHYSPNKDYLLIDGGINDSVITNLFPIRETAAGIYTFVCAGLLWDQNGTKLILEAMKLNKDPKIKVIFAGQGIDVPIIEEAAKRDSRIEYLGMLTMEQLFKTYEQADVLLNLRIEEEIDFHFPSKLLEYLVTGKYVISTPIAHAERDYGNLMGVLKDVTPKGLADMIEATMALGKQKLFEIGKTARGFMLTSRTWSYRTTEIINYIEDETRNSAE